VTNRKEHRLTDRLQTSVPPKPSDPHTFTYFSTYLTTTFVFKTGFE
jgi:hypothetical protein